MSSIGELHFPTGVQRYDWASCVFIFPRGLVMTFSSSSVQRFRRLLDCSPWTNLSWWCLHYGRTLLPTLRSDFVGLRKLVGAFSSSAPYCKLHRSNSLLYLFLLPTLQLDFYCILFYNDLYFLTLQLEFLVGHPLGGLI